MNWTVTFRDKIGNRAQCVVEADSRDALFSELKERGILPISVAEGDSAAKVSVRRGGASIVRGLFGGIGAVVVVCAVSWFFAANRSKPANHDILQKSAQVIEVTPQKIPRPQIEPVAKEKPTPYWELDESQTNKLSETQLKKWRTIRRPRTKPYTRERPKARYEIFDHRSENMIASLLAAKPGQGFIGTPNYKDIDKDFLESCTKPIIVTKDDDEYSAELKREMIEVKIDLRNRMAEGEDLAEILQSSRDEMQKLAAYRRMLSEEVHKVEISDGDAESVKDLIDAANKMLATKGIEPLKPNPITEIRLKRLNIKGANE